MRLGLVRHVGLGVGALALVWLAACDDNPLSFDVKTTTGITTNPSEMAIPAGRTAKLESRAVNQGGEPTFADVTPSIDATCAFGANAGTIDVVVDPDDESLIEAGVLPPGRFTVTAVGANGDPATLGQTCIVLTSGGVTAQVDVTVVAEAIEITSAPDTLRAGETGQVLAHLIDADGREVLPYAAESVAWASDAPTVADFTDNVGNFSTEVAGTAVLSATWTGQEANGTVVEGVELADTHVLTVVANIPFELDDPALDNGDDFGVIAVDQVAEAEILVLDEFGNQNTDENEILSCTATSSDPAIASADCAIEIGSAHAIVSVTGVSVGTGVDISGDVTTSEGTFTWGPAPVTVLNPIVDSVTPSTGSEGLPVTILGSGFTFTGFDTQVSYRANTATGQPQIIDDLFIDDLTETQIDMVIPGAGLFPAGEYEIIVTVGVEDDDGVVQGVSSLILFNQTAASPEYSSNATEPQNDTPATAPTITFPAAFVGQYVGADVDDYFKFTWAGGTFVVDMDWTDSSVDLDILVRTETGGFACFDGATGAKPEQSTCTLDPGTYFLQLNNYDGPDHPTQYRVWVTLP